MLSRSPFHARILAGLVLLGALAVARPAAATWSSNAMLPMSVCTLPGTHFISRGCADGAGGMFIAWEDSRNGTYDIYAQHLDARGNALWAANGVPVAVAANAQTYPVLCLDGAGGCYIAWNDFRTSTASGDVYAMRLASNGSPFAGWTVNGINISTAQNDQPPFIASDGAGGAYVAFTVVYSFTDKDPFIARIGPGGLAWGPTAGTSETHVQDVLSLVASGGNAFLLWKDMRGGVHYDLYGQAWTPAGAPLAISGGKDLGWISSAQIENGIAVANGTGGIDYVFNDTGNIYVGFLPVDFGAGPVATVAGGISGMRTAIAAEPDGSGGVFAVWLDARSGGSSSDLYASHVQSTAGIAPGWVVNGNLVAPGVSSGYAFALSDGLGGVLLSWVAGGSITMQHLDGSGALWPLWPGTGRLAGPGGGAHSITSDGAQGALLTIDYQWNGSSFGVHAQRVERFSQIGDPGPAITGVKDVKNDQGGNLKVSWNASSLDLPPSFTVNAYDVWRSVPAAAAASAIRAGAKAVAADAVPGAGDPGRRLIALPTATSGYAWEYVGRQAASTSASYSYIVPTLADSIAGSNPFTVVRVRALPAYGSSYWESAPDSGYSVDNLPPAIPAPFAGTYAAGSASLHWSPSTAPDFARFRLHRGTSASFVPSAGNLVSAQPDTGFVDAAGSLFYYKLAAEDAHGNLSGFATLLPSGTADVGGAVLPRAVFLAPVSPNPARSGATLRFGLPSAARAELSLFDAAGRRVRSLASGDLAAGEHAIRWDGLGEAGAPVVSGLLFVRLETGGRTLVQRMVVVR
jgi:hypothetical protein